MTDATTTPELVWPFGFRLLIPARRNIDPMVPVPLQRLPLSLGALRWQAKRPVKFRRLLLSSLTASFVSVLAGVASKGAQPLVIGEGPLPGELYQFPSVRRLEGGGVPGEPGSYVELWLANNDRIDHEVFGMVELEVPGDFRWGDQWNAKSPVGTTRFNENMIAAVELVGIEACS